MPTSERGQMTDTESENGQFCMCRFFMSPRPQKHDISQLNYPTKPCSRTKGASLKHTHLITMENSTHYLYVLSILWLLKISIYSLANMLTEKLHWNQLCITSPMYNQSVVSDRIPNQKEILVQGNRILNKLPSVRPEFFTNTVYSLMCTDGLLHSWQCTSPSSQTEQQRPEGPQE